MRDLLSEVPKGSREEVMAWVRTIFSPPNKKAARETTRGGDGFPAGEVPRSRGAPRRGGGGCPGLYGVSQRALEADLVYQPAGEAVQGGRGCYFSVESMVTLYEGLEEASREQLAQEMAIG